VAIYLLFGVVFGGRPCAEEFATISSRASGFSRRRAGIFTGVILATEREGNRWLKRACAPAVRRSSPGRMSIGVAAVAITLVAGRRSSAEDQLSSPRWRSSGRRDRRLHPFCAIRLLLGAASGSAAPAWGNLLFLPMVPFGLFLPLPEGLKSWVLLWPTFHLDQLALGLAGVEKFTYIPPAMAAAVLAGVTVVCGGLAIRRLARVG
jgi:ABC-2 type transport system permease protein